MLSSLQLLSKREFSAAGSGCASTRECRVGGTASAFPILEAGNSPRRASLYTVDLVHAENRATSDTVRISSEGDTLSKLTLVVGPSVVHNGYGIGGRHLKL